MHPKFNPLFLFLAFFLIHVGCNTQKKTTIQVGDIAFTGVSVFPMTENTVLSDQTVIIRDGKIWKIGSSADLKLVREGTVIDAKGQYLMPGIAEMHAHIPTPREGNDENVREVLFWIIDLFTNNNFEYEILFMNKFIEKEKGLLGNGKSSTKNI